jgi:amidase
VTVDLERTTAAALVAGLRSGAVSSRELLDAQLAQMDRWNPTVNAVVATDVDAARRAAQEVDDARARGAALGPLAGLPMTVKDSFETRGLVTTSGAPDLRDHVPEADADAVARLREAGAIVFGKTNLPMYAGDWQTYNDVYGLTRNPWDVTRGAGGSSGGSAAAVATGMSPLELGSDIGGSIRVPAHFCGVFGHKPTQGAVPDRGHVPGPPGTMAPPDLGVTGPLGRSAADLELAMDALLACGLRDGPGSLPAASSSAGTMPRVAVYLDDSLCPPSGEVRDVIERAVASFEAAGAHIVEVAVPPLADTHRLYQRLLSSFLAIGMPPELLAQLAPAAADPGHPFHELATDSLLSHRDWLMADEGRHRLRARWAAEVFPFADVVLAPVAPIVAFPHDTETPFARRMLEVDGERRNYRDVMLPWPGLATLPGLPATAVPVGRTAAGLPVGVQLVGARWADRTCLAAAALLEQATGGFAPPPMPRAAAPTS